MKTPAVSVVLLGVVTACAGKHERATYPDPSGGAQACEVTCKGQFYAQHRYKNVLRIASCHANPGPEGPRVDCDVVWDWVGE